MFRVGKLLAAMAIALAGNGSVAAQEVFPPGPVFYGPAWPPGAGLQRGSDAFYPGPVGYRPDAYRAAVFPQGPVYYGPSVSADSVFPPGPAQYGPRAYEVFRPGPVGYGPLGWREPYYGFPYPPCSDQRSTKSKFQWPSCFIQEGQSAPRGGNNLPSHLAQPRGMPAPPVTPQVPSPSARSAKPSESETAPSLRGDTYRFEGNTIYSPHGSAYYGFGARPPFGSVYERYGNMLYGVGSRAG